ncbi:MAG: carboxylating nicotinate-nucleotide diphosphorylase [Candidatus Omnitrophota bacterium]
MKKDDIQKIVRSTLQEDIGRGDITTNFLIPPHHQSRAVIIAKGKAVLCGCALVREIFRQLDPALDIVFEHKDGDPVDAKDVLIRLQGRTRAILTGERAALNFLSYLSAVATKTHDFCRAVKPYNVKILDTRKTTPAMRVFERYAVACGGGVNHRFNLNEMVLMKDNHRVVCRKHESLLATVRRLHRKTHKKVQIEVDHLWELKEVLEAHPEMVLLDNMSLAELKTAVRLTRKLFPLKKRPLLEASGGVTLKNVRRIAATGVDRISIGSLTHSRLAVDMSLEITDE